MIDICPNCHRKLLSHTSSSCNWCGQEIADEEYQADSKVKRDAFQLNEQLDRPISQLNPFLRERPIDAPPVSTAISRRLALEMEAKLSDVRLKRAETNADRDQDWPLTPTDDAERI